MPLYPVWQYPTSFYPPSLEALDLKLSSGDRRTLVEYWERKKEKGAGLQTKLFSIVKQRCILIKK